MWGQNKFITYKIKVDSQLTFKYKTDQVQMTGTMCGSAKSLLSFLHIDLTKGRLLRNLQRKKLWKPVMKYASILDFNLKETYLKVRRLSSIKKWLFKNCETLLSDPYWKKKMFQDRKFNFAKSFVALNDKMLHRHAPSPLVERLSSERSFRRARVW